MLQPLGVSQLDIGHRLQDEGPGGLALWLLVMRPRDLQFCDICYHIVARCYGKGEGTCTLRRSPCGSLVATTSPVEVVWNEGCCRDRNGEEHQFVQWCRMG